MVDSVAFTTAGGARLTLRPIVPGDEPKMVRFHGTLSEQSVYARYFHMMRLGVRVSHERLARICHADFTRDIVLVAEAGDEGARSIVGVGRLTLAPARDEAEFAIVVSDAWQGQGLGTALLRRLVDIGRARGLRRITADILPDNQAMQHASRHVGFTCRFDPDAGVVRAALDLG